AIQCFQLVLDQCPVGHPHRAAALTNLAWARLQGYTRNYFQDIDSITSLFREALALRPQGHPDHPSAIYHLLKALIWRYRKERMRYISRNLCNYEGVHLRRVVLKLCPLGNEYRPRTLDKLAEAVEARFHQRGAINDLARAYSIVRHCVTIHFTKLSLHITSALCLRFTKTRKHEDIEEVIQLCQKSLDGLPSLHPSRYFSYVVLQRAYLSLDAASCAIRHDDLRRAVELLEQGRGQHGRWPLDSGLRWNSWSLQINQRLSDSQGSAGGTGSSSNTIQETSGAVDTVVAEIRSLQGFSRFMLPPSYADLQVAACHGPVIILVASEYSCSAIIVPTSGEPRHISFPRMNLTHLEVLKKDFTREIRHASGDKEKIARPLRIVWDEIMLPIVIVLQRDLRVGNRSRIWLCPTATFTSIPLHAANPFRMKAYGRARELCLEDVYICSYTPTLSALIRSRQMMKTRVTPCFAAIGQSELGAGQGEALKAIDSELELVRKIIPATASPTTLSGDDATRAGALNALQHNTWVHLACHGKQDREQPYYSRFAMKDEPVTLLDITEKDIPHAEFAFLSACHTAVGDERTPDEVIHLAAGLQFSGFKSVIGTLWALDDAVANHVVKAFYENMVEDLKDGDMMDCTKAAGALNRATCSVKTQVPLEQRMVFIHIGL
ncbi:CHAT domain-containing protein, partial [Suillus spraguei]